MREGSILYVSNRLQAMVSDFITHLPTGHTPKTITTFLHTAIISLILHHQSNLLNTSSTLLFPCSTVRIQCRLFFFVLMMEMHSDEHKDQVGDIYGVFLTIPYNGGGGGSNRGNIQRHLLFAFFSSFYPFSLGIFYSLSLGNHVL